MIALIDIRMRDGSRHFAALPQTRLWHDVRIHVESLAGARITEFLCDNITEAWIDFTWHGYTFTINDQMGEYFFFVNDPECPENWLMDVATHFARLLKPSLLE